jgi:hypothetical protein
MSPGALPQNLMMHHVGAHYRGVANEMNTSVDFNERRLETFKALNTLSLELFKALNLLNAGAAFGMLAGVDKIEPLISALNLRLSISFFVVGLLLGLFAMLFGWLTLYRRLHLADARITFMRSYRVMMIVTVLVALGALVCFSTGAMISVFGFHYPGLLSAD